jgi:DNA-binding CsgD family transcriptional regulator
VEHARTLCDLGAGLQRANRRREARDRLGEALELAHACGAYGLAKRALTELQVAGARPRRMATTGPASLTPSERRVVEIAAAGLSNREIAQALFVTLGTVEAHLTSSYRKLSVARREELAAALE